MSHPDKFNFSDAKEPRPDRKRGRGRFAMTVAALAATVALGAVSFGGAQPVIEKIVTVFVANSASDPVPAYVTNSPNDPVPTQPQLLGLPIQILERGDCGNSSCAVEVYTVPDDKILIIEFAHVRTELGNHSDGAAFSLNTSLGGVRIDHELGMLGSHPIDGLNAQFQGGSMVRIYADPGTTVFARVSNGLGGPIRFIRAGFSGRLIGF